MRIGIYLRGISAHGGYPQDFNALADALEATGHQVFRYRGGPESRNRSLQSFEANTDRLDVLHLIGIFRSGIFRAAAMARRGGIPYICSPIAQHAPDHIRNSNSLAKRSALTLYRRGVVRFAAAVHFFSNWEQSIKDLHRPRFIAALGVPPPGHEAEERAPGPDFVFFGRNDVYQKGLDLLIEAAAVVREDLGGRQIRIVGRPHGDSDRVLTRLINRFGVEDVVELSGPSVDLAPLASARSLIYPSRFDGPPRPPRAALALGVPLVVTAGTNLGDGVNEHQAGWVADVGVESLATAIASAARADDGSMADIRKGSGRLAERWSWENVAKDYLAGYELALGSL